MSSESEAKQTESKNHDDLESADPNPHQPFDSGDASAAQELTLRYLCDNNKLSLQDPAPAASAAAAPAPAPVAPVTSFLLASRSKGKEVVSDDDRWVERDFLRLSSTVKRELPPTTDTSAAPVDPKKPKMEALSLSLAPPHLSLSLEPNPAPATAPAPPPPRRAHSGNTIASRMTASSDFGASLSGSYSVPFSHNPSCSLTRNSTDNYGDTDQIWFAGEGTNGSVHSRFRPIDGGSSVAFTNPGSYTKDLTSSVFLPSKDLNSNSVYRAANSASESHSLFPSELPARPPAPALSSDSARNGTAMLTRPDRVLREIASESIPYMAQILIEFTPDSLESLKDCLRNMMAAPDKKDDFAGLRRRLERRSDLNAETLSKCNKTQLEVLVAIKTGVPGYVTGNIRIPAPELIDIFLLERCPNLECKTPLPVDDCECSICTTNKGFCSACMCPICLQYDCANNTCSWVGCDVCSHWCHAACGLDNGLIKPANRLKGGLGMTEMQFHCAGCGHDSEMFGFIKEVFQCCAKDWGLEKLTKELDCVVKIFQRSEDFEGKELQRKAEELRAMLSKKQISPMDACKGMLEFFKYGASDFSVTGSSSKNILKIQANQTGDVLPIPQPTTITPLKSTFNLQPSTTIMGVQMNPVKADPKPPVPEPRSQAKEDGFQSLETMVKFKEAESKLFQRLADDATREVESYRQIVRAKSEKLEEEYATKVAKLCLQETEERRRKKIEELKFLENSQRDYLSMKMRMQAEIATLLERIESIKKQWA